MANQPNHCVLTQVPAWDYDGAALVLVGVVEQASFGGRVDVGAGGHRAACRKSVDASCKGGRRAVNSAPTTLPRAGAWRWAR